MVATVSTRTDAQPTARPMDLVAAYDPARSVVFAGPERTVLATGNRLGAGAQTDPADLVDRARSVMDGPGPDLVLAAIPFDAQRAAALVHPDTVARATGARAGGGTTVGSPPPSTGAQWRLGRVPDREVYAAGVVESLARIDRGELGKIVLARSLDLTGGGPVDPAAILRRLAARDPGSYAYAMALPPGGTGPRTLVGASPELLVRRTGRQVVSLPIAGSAERSGDPVLDRARGAALLTSAKDLAEHAFVADAVRDSLAPSCARLTTSGPRLVATATMWHLQTEVVGELADLDVSSLELALALHPTPAVCGVPTAVARAAIGELEGFDRDFYAGVVGWCDRAGDGEWVVAIRCAEVRPDAVRLYSGAGIVAGSVPEAEVAETSAKFRTMLEAIGLDDVA